MTGGLMLTLRHHGLFLTPTAAFFCLAVLISTPSFAGQKGQEARYIGSKACRPCHKKEYASFTKYAQKSKSYQAIERLKKGLSKNDLKKCYGCHTTGYGKPGGFISVEKTPGLKNDGCEVCHGPGSIHARTQDPAAIKSHLTRKDCDVCHISARIKAFRYTPLIHGGGH